MKFLLCQYLFGLILISSLYCYRIRHFENEIKGSNDNDDLVIKLTESYYHKIGPQNVKEFRSMVFTQLGENKEDSKKEVHRPGNRTFNDLNLHTINNVTYRQDRIFTTDYISTTRYMKFYISQSSDCSVFINDTVTYQFLSNSNFIEHMILHNNAENIDPKGVYSDDVKIKFFTFNRKMNIFQVYFENPGYNRKEINNNSTFSIEFDYEAINLIKSNYIQDERKGNFINTTYPSVFNYNSFLWKILNQNFVKAKEFVVIEIYFDLGKEFEHEDVEFSLNFTKSIIHEKLRNFVKYEWKGSIEPQEMIILEAKLPLYFEHCRTLNVNLWMIFVGAVFIIFLIGMLYFILSSVFLDEI